MASKSKKPVAPKAEQYPRKAVPVHGGKSEEEGGHNYAVLTTSPELAAYRVINGAEQKSGIGELIDVPTLLSTLRDQAAAVNRGDLAQAEAMLMNQATALQSLFARLSERGMSCDQVAGFEANLRMALRAQSQCRATLETLAAIKNPPIVYAKQANFANGPQQVNNGIPPQAGKTESVQSKLLEAQHGNYLDTSTAGAAIGANPELATVGEVDRAEVGRR